MLRCLLQTMLEMQESNQKSNQKGNRKSEQRVLAAMEGNPDITIKELQQIVGLSESGIKKIIRQLRAAGRIERIGGAKGGHWEVK